MAIGGAFDVLPAQKVVTLKPRNPTAADVSIRAVRRPWTQLEAARFGEGLINQGPERAAFLLKNKSTAGVATVPRTDWLITDADGNTWSILQVIRELEDTDGPQIYRCSVAKQQS